MLPRFRTILVTLLTIAVALVGGIISVTTYTTTIAIMRGFADDIAIEISESSKLNFDATVNRAEKSINMFANVFGNRIQDPGFIDIASLIWRLFIASRENNHLLGFVEPVHGRGFLLQGDHWETVFPDGKGGFLAKSTVNGVERPVPDMREADWFKAARDGKAQPGNGWISLRDARILTDLSINRGLILYQAIRPEQENGKLAGAIGIALSGNWLRLHLVEALGRQDFKASAFILEVDPATGVQSLIVHTDPAINALLDNSKGPVSPLECGDGTMAAITGEIGGVLLRANHPRQFRILHGHEIFHVTHTSLKPANGPHWILCHAIRDSEITTPALQRLTINLAVTLGVLVLVLGLGILFSLRVARPMEQLTLMAEATGRLDLSDRKKVFSGIREISHLAGAVESMRAGLKSFLRFLPEDLVRRYLMQESPAGLESEVVPVTILFTDIKGFSSVAERVDSLTLVRHLNDYLEIMSANVSRHGGTVDKYIGDAVMSFWNAPNRVPRHAREACAAALGALDKLEEAREKWVKAGLPPFHTRFGIHTGEVILGNIGSSVRLNYTIIGDAVNLASRLENLSKQYGTTVLLSEPTRQEAGGEFLTRPVDLVAVKGKSDPVMVHELMGWRAEATPKALDLARLTAEAHQLYLDRRFQEARDAYAAILADWPGDPVSETMMGRSAEFNLHAPPEGWSGVNRPLVK